MSARGFRAITYASVGGSGLWSVAAGLLTHHTIIARIGGAVAVIAVLLFFATDKQTSEE